MSVSNCHINSNVYLKNFGSIPISVKKQKKKINPRNIRVYVFDKRLDERPKKRKVGEICIEKDIYSDYTEGFLHVRVENHLNEVLKSIIKNRSFFQLTQEQKEEIIRYILVMLVRTPRYIHMTIKLHKYIRNIDNSIFLNSLDYKCNKQNERNQLPIDIATIKKWQNRQIQLVSNSPCLLKDYKWILYLNKTNIPFYTADNPVLHNLQIFFRNCYIYEASPQKIIRQFYFPISPKIALGLFNPKKILVPVYFSLLTITNKNYIYYLNNRMIYNAEKEVILPSYDQYDFKKTIALNKNCLSQKKFQFKFKKFEKENINRHNLIIPKDGKCACRYCKKEFNSKKTVRLHLNNCRMKLLTQKNT